MRLITENDAKILASMTRLSVKNLKNLTEESRDLSLLLLSLSKKFTLSSAKNLSLLPYYRVAFLTHTSENFPLEETSYVSDSVAKFLPKLAETGYIKKLENKKPNEESAQYRLVTCGLSPSPKKIQIIDTYFRTHNRRELANHLDKWISIFNLMKSAGWFSKFENGVINSDESKNHSNRSLYSVI